MMAKSEGRGGGADKNTKNNNGCYREANNTTKIILTRTGGCGCGSASGSGCGMDVWYI